MKKKGSFWASSLFFVVLCSQNAWSILAIDDSYIIPQDDPGFLINPLVNDIISLSGSIPLTNADFRLQVGQGSIDTGTGSILVIPATGFVGQLEFAYSVRDATGVDSARIVIDVQAAPAPHQAVADFHHVLQNDFPINFNVLANDNFSFTNGVQIITIGTTAQGGIVNIDATGLSVSYQPPTNYTGLDSFTYDLQDQATLVVSQGLITVFVGVNPGQNPPVFGATTEEQGTIDVIDQICNDNPNGPLPCTLIAGLTDAQKRSLAQQVSGRHAKAQSRAIRQIKNRQSNNVRSRLSEIRGGQNRVSVNNLNTVVFNESVPLGKAFQPIVNKKLSGGSAGEEDIATPWGFFVNGNLSFGEGIGQNDRPQYDQDGFNITSGSDYRMSDNLVIGGAFGYSESNFDFSFNRGTQNSDSLTLSFFGNYYPTRNLYIDWIAMLVKTDLDINRRINVATFTQSLSSNTSSQQEVVASSLGYEFYKNKWQGSLYARAEYSSLTIDAYTEGNGGAFQLQVGEQQNDSLDYALGGRLGYVFSLKKGILIPSIEIESVKQSDDELAIESRFAQVSVAQGLRLNGADQDTAYANASASLSAVFGGGRSGFFRYESVVGHDDYKANNYTLGFRIEF